MREVNTHKIIRIFLASSIDDTKEERDKLQNKILAVWNPIFNKFNNLRKNQGTGFAYTAIRFGAASQEQYRRLLALLTGAMQSENTEASFEPVRWFTLSPTVRPLAIPTAVEQNKVLHIVSLNTLQDAAVACTPPQRSYPGFWLEGQSDEQLFPAVEAFTAAALQ